MAPSRRPLRERCNTTLEVETSLKPSAPSPTYSPVEKPEPACRPNKKRGRAESVADKSQSRVRDAAASLDRGRKRQRQKRGREPAEERSASCDSAAEQDALERAPPPERGRKRQRRFPGHGVAEPTEAKPDVPEPEEHRSHSRARSFDPQTDSRPEAPQPVTPRSRSRSRSFDPYTDARPQAPQPTTPPSRSRSRSIDPSTIERPQAPQPTTPPSPDFAEALKPKASSRPRARKAEPQAKKDKDPKRAHPGDGFQELIPDLFLATLAAPAACALAAARGAAFTHVVHVVSVAPVQNLSPTPTPRRAKGAQPDAPPAPARTAGETELVCDAETGMQTLRLFVPRFTVAKALQLAAGAGRLTPAQLVVARDFISLALPYHARPKSRRVHVNVAGRRERARVLVTASAAFRRAEMDVMGIGAAYLAFSSGESAETVLQYIEEAPEIADEWLEACGKVSGAGTCGYGWIEVLQSAVDAAA